MLDGSRQRTERTSDIVLFDANSYYASCHQAVQPDLRGKPVIVAGDPKNRSGIVLTASYEARRFGIKTTMPIRQALNLCPEAVVLKPDFALYLELSGKMWQVVRRYTDEGHIQVVSIDECFADFQGSQRLFGDTPTIARRVQAEIFSELSLGISVGISYCKILAKLASDYARDPLTRIKCPRSFTVIQPEDLREKVWPLPLGELSGIGKQLEQRFSSIGLKTIEDLAHADPLMIRLSFGLYGERLYQWANGIDDRPVTPEEPVSNRSLGRSVTLPQNILDPDQVAQVLLVLSESVGRKVRQEKVKARTLTLTLKDTRLKSHTYSTTLPEPTDSSLVFYRECLNLYNQRWPIQEPIRLIGISAGKLYQGPEQLSLFSEKEVEAKQLTQTLDRLKDKYGSHSVMRATELLDLGQNVSRRKD
ncbi:MAG: DNA polymerase Y family protein [Desulfitobacteriaceae bacterium]